MISNNVFPTKFAADVKDVLITGASESRSVQLMKGGQLILSETYHYDNDGNIRIGGLAEVISLSLYGELKMDDQPHAKDTFTLNIYNEEPIQHTLYSMRLQNPHDPDGTKNLMAVAEETVCYPGRPHLITAYGQQIIKLLSWNGTELDSITLNQRGLTSVYTYDLDPKKIFPGTYHNGAWLKIGSEQRARILPQASDEFVTVRFLNRYDMPESLTAAYMTEKPSVTDDTAQMFGNKTRFSVKSATEYTLHSGRLYSDWQYDTWQDLLTSRKAQLLWHGQWIDIVITKGNYTRKRRDMYRTQAEVSFQTANPLMTI